MEVFSFFKFWRNAGTVSSVVVVDTTISTSSDVDRNQALETDDDDEDSFFELVFTAPDCNGKVEDNEENKKVGDSTFKFVDSRKDVFFKGRVFPIESSSNSKTQSPISLLKSPPKFPVFMLGFKKSKSETMKTNGASMAKPKHRCQQSKRFTVKCKVEEVPIVSLFTRDNSLRSKLEEDSLENVSSFDSSKRFPNGIQKYLKLIKPLYVKASKRFNQSSALMPLASPATAPVHSPRKLLEKQGNFPVGLRGVCRHLGKSKSASSAVVTMPSPASRRDDSLLQQNDGIQSAILHCKRSYNSSSKDCSLLSRPASDSSYQKSINPPRNSIDEQKRVSI